VIKVYAFMVLVIKSQVKMKYPANMILIMGLAGDKVLFIIQCLGEN